MTVTFTICDDITGYAPNNQRFAACLGDNDLDQTYGHGATPQDAIADLVNNYDLDIT